ncbi:hypothetical protein QJS04_geneDACA008592 [Acorus gramineus]|uniref:DUF7138 domain-containing protein n=1 Tax=Acorus gramineus TaxID=55184 RepID=A0AAV9AJ26_ACOGR|nr:hypothetical protein QJS04_geneDACA008592 [Acorus gramineus]
MTDLSSASIGGGAVSASFPVVFYDGKREVDIGDVTIDSTFRFKRLLTILSRKIGVQPHQISVSLTRRRRSRPSGEVRRKVPIDESTDFVALTGERDCFLLAVLRRSTANSRRRSSSGRHRHVIFDDEDEILLPPQIPAPTLPMTLLRRNPAAAVLGFMDYQEQMRNLLIEREKYLMSSSSAGLPYAYAYKDGANTVVSGTETEAVCEECLASKEWPVPFHWCVRDTVTVGFRSKAGPIERPSKKIDGSDKFSNL